jgi:hypothetical protein
MIERNARPQAAFGRLAAPPERQAKGPRRFIVLPGGRL